MTYRFPRGHALLGRPAILLGLVLLVTGIVTGCANKNFAALRPGLETRGRYIEGVPFYQQSEATCGPAALASILAFRGRPESLERITEKIYLPELRGTLPMDMEKYARDAGFKTTAAYGTFDELKAYIRREMPIICMLDLGFSVYHRPHYISVIGFDDVNAVVIGHDGKTPNSVIGYEKFNREWSRAGRWMLVIEPAEGVARHEP
jgi:ABC-type bacteriocin/lantibiotic exporter with double-glycine peptidase domain